MKLGYKVGGLSNFYEVMHAWANQEYLKKCGIGMAISLPVGVAEVTKENFISKIKKIFRKNPINNEMKLKYQNFVEDYIDSSDETMKGITFLQMEYTFGKLEIPKELKELEGEDPTDGYVSSLLLLNRLDYQKLIQPVSVESPYIFTSIEKDEISKTIYIKDFVNSKEMNHVYFGTNPKNYPDAKYENDAGPLELLSLIYHADGILTDSLPVLELAIVFGKNFLYLNGGRGEGKAVLMLEQLGIRNHFVHDPAVKDNLVRYEAEEDNVIRNRLIRARKDTMKQLVNFFPEINTDKLDSCECPTGISRTGCYGCLACKEVCPTNAITMEEDDEGFLYPVTDYDKCIQCGLCKKICIRNKKSSLNYEEGYPRALCAKNKDEDILNKSTSGAIFPAIAKYTIEKMKGAVVGVKYDEHLNVVADIAETMEAVEPFYGSKYVKSSYDGIFPKVKQLLSDERFVLYTGLPCECAGLRSFLQKEYDNLLICEILCHSVPSPKVYRKYLAYLEEKKKTKLTKLVFREKTETHPKMVFTFKKGAPIRAKYWKNNYFRAFSNDYISRTSCSRCAFNYQKRVGDLTIGDFWGVSKVYPEIVDKKGMSFILMNNEKGENVIRQVEDSFMMKELTVQQAFIKNHRKSKPLQPEREELFGLLDEVPIDKLLGRYNDLLKKEEEAKLAKEAEQSEEDQFSEDAEQEEINAQELVMEG